MCTRSDLENARVLKHQYPPITASTKGYKKSQKEKRNQKQNKNINKEQRAAINQSTEA